MGILHDLTIKIGRKITARDTQYRKFNEAQFQFERDLNNILQTPFEGLGNNYNLNASKIQNQRLRDVTLRKTERNIEEYHSLWNNTLTEEEINQTLDLHYEKIDLLEELRAQKVKFSKEKMERLLTVLTKTNDQDGLDEMEKIEKELKILDRHDDGRESLSQHLENAIKNADVTVSLNVEGNNIKVAGKIIPKSNNGPELSR